MHPSAASVRFVGMLASTRAEAAVRECIGALQARCREAASWEVCVQPPLAGAAEAGYAVRAQARLADGSTIAIRSHARELLQAVRDAFEGMEQLFEEYGGAARGSWLGHATPSRPALPA